MRLVRSEKSYLILTFSWCYFLFYRANTQEEQIWWSNRMNRWRKEFFFASLFLHFRLLKYFKRDFLVTNMYAKWLLIKNIVSWSSCAIFPEAINIPHTIDLLFYFVLFLFFIFIYFGLEVLRVFNIGVGQRLQLQR